MQVGIDAMADMLITTLADYPEKNMFESCLTNHNYVFARIYAAKRKKITGGTSIKRNVMLDIRGNARYKQAFATDTQSVQNAQHQTDVHWTMFDCHYAWDKSELLDQRGAAGYIDVVISRKQEQLIGLADLIEARGWTTPISATDKKNPFGIPYYLNFLENGASTAGFHGKTIRYEGGTTGTICADIDASTETKWRNYADVYTSVDNALLRKLRQAIITTQFNRPSMVPNQGLPDAAKYGANSVELYTNLENSVELADLSDQRDDNSTPNDLAGKMLYSKDGVAYFNKMPIIYVDALDSMTVVDGGSAQFSPDPIYCVDWSRIQPVVREGHWMVESPVYNDGHQHTTYKIFNDSSHNNLCLNRRSAGFVLHRLIPAA